MTGNILAMDPGFSARGKGCALALSVDRVLVWVGWARPVFPQGVVMGGRRCDVILWEKPQLDGRSRDKAQTILELMHVGSLLAAQLAERFGATLTELTPTEWKGGEHKPQQHARMWERLGPVERVVLGGATTWQAIDRACEIGARTRWADGGNTYPKSFEQHNILDAAALNLRFTGRM